MADKADVVVILPRRTKRTHNACRLFVALALLFFASGVALAFHADQREQATGVVKDHESEPTGETKVALDNQTQSLEHKTQNHEQDHAHAIHSYFLLDRTGSMGAMQDGVRSGYRKYVTEQQEKPGKMYHSLAQFDSQDPFEVVVEAQEIKQVNPDLIFTPRATTPLYDAIDAMIDYAERTSHGSDDVIIVVFTDGAENASRRASREGIFAKVERFKKRGWTFVFLGANIDSYATGGAMGYSKGSTMNYAATSSGIDYGWGTVSRAMTKSRVARRQPDFNAAERVKMAEDGFFKAPGGPSA